VEPAARPTGGGDSKADARGDADHRSDAVQAKRVRDRVLEERPHRRVALEAERPVAGTLDERPQPLPVPAYDSAEARVQAIRLDELSALFCTRSRVGTRVRRQRIPP